MNYLVKTPKRINCQICGRQIVNYDADNKLYVGKPGAPHLYLIGGYACHVCTKEEQELERLGYYDGIFESAPANAPVDIDINIKHIDIYV